MVAFKLYLKKVFFIIDDKTKSKFMLLLVLFVVSSMLDMAGVGLIGGFVSLVLKPAAVASILPGSLAVYYKSLGVKKVVGLVGGVIIVLFIAKALVAYLVQRKITQYGFSQLSRLQVRLMKVFMRMPYHYFMKRNSSSLINIIQYNANQFVGNALMPIFQLAVSSITVLGLFVLLFYLNPVPLIGMMLFFFVILVVYDRCVKGRLKQYGLVAAKASSGVVKGVQQGLGGLKEIRVLGCESYFYNRVESESRILARSNSLNNTLQYVPRYIIESAMVTFVIALFLIYMVVKGDPLQVLPILTVFMAAGTRILPMVTLIMASVNKIRFSHSVVDELHEELKSISHIESCTAINMSHKGARDKVNFSDILFKAVFYQYPGTKRYVLSDINMTISKGESIGIIGPSGAGKTTLIDLLLGLLIPSAGHVFADEHSINNNTQRWQRTVAYVPQNIFIMDDTLRRNVALGIPDHDICQEKLMKALVDAQLVEVITALPGGVDTVLGEQGARLSGGQRQRVALARAFYHDRDIIVMDEATSALDAETEKDVVNAIKSLKGRKTIVVVAHRLSTIQHCDRLYRLDKGCLTAVGTYQEVIGV